MKPLQFPLSVKETYITRDERIVRLRAHIPEDGRSHPWHGVYDGDKLGSWTETARYCRDGFDHSLDIVGML